MNNRKGRNIMIKMIYCVRRLPDIGHDEFHKYWLEKHGPLVRERAPAMNVKRYVQSHTIPDSDDVPLNEGLRQSRGSLEPFDGAAELWWESIEDLVAQAGTPEGAKAAEELLEDEKNFIDFSRSSIFFVEEHEIHNA
jgi:uncharacterized protein (TIGR02118 family)